MKDLIIPDSVYPYLRVQKGEINHIEDRKEFEAAYNNGLCDLFNAMLPHIPKDMKSSLDIGSGMGGIDILLQRHFNHKVFLLDGVSDLPVCVKHDIPFNNSRITESFFFENNCHAINSYWDPKIKHFTEAVLKKGDLYKYDLILSVGSYCFHYSPLLYLDFVKASCHKDTVLIFDVRNRHADWLEILRENFTEVAVLVESEKFTKRVFKAKC